MPGVRIRDDQFLAGSRFRMRLERTLRVPNDGRSYPLPPSFGAFPVYRVGGYPALKGMADRGEYFVPMYQWEAMWLSFEAEEWKPNAVQVAAGGVNVLTGAPFPSPLSGRPQNYLVCPLQPWLDGIKTKDGGVSQFVAAPIGEGITVEEQLAGQATRGGLQVRVFEPRPGIFPERKPRGISPALFSETLYSGSELGLAGGGTIEQKVYPDPHGVRTWDANNFYDIRLLIVNSAQFREVTGEEPPPSPISAADYERLKLPWFRLFDEDLGDVRSSSKLRKLKTAAPGDESVEAKTIRGIKRRK